MPTIPGTRSLNASSVDILNAIRNNATANYRDYVPAAQENLDSIREIGSIIMDYPALRNEFVSALINRIGATLLESRTYTNPWSVFKRGKLQFGETIEAIFTNIAKPHTYNPEVAESKIFKREIPDIRAAFFTLNYTKFYKQTLENERLRQAFLSWDGVTSLISDIVDAMYTADAVDEFLTMKYMLARNILNGSIKAVEIDANDIKGTISTVKATSNRWTFNRTDYNRAGVNTNSKKNQQYIIVNSDFDAVMDVEVLAAAFNMSKADFMGHRVLVDSFGSMDTTRLNELFSGESWYQALTSDEIAALDAIPAVLVDERWFMIFDNLFEFTEQYNGEGLYWQYWLHDWKTFAVSPFANAAVFVPGKPAITSVTVEPAAVTLIQGQSATLKATVVTANFASQAVDWTSSDTGGKVTVDIYGTVSVADDATAGTYTITATSVFDSTKSDTCTVTVPSAE